MKISFFGSSLILALLSLASGSAMFGQAEGVAGTLHNLSSSGPGEIRATEETEICKFCHVPHNATVPTPLWGRELPTVEFRTSELRRGRPDRQPAPQPDGSSRLCLSCHDGTVALGDVSNQYGRIALQGAERLSPGRSGFLGTDLSGSHPVSFVVPSEPASATEDSDMSLRPLESIRSDPDVHLDEQGKMQCTTCHDPHADRFYQEGRVPRFWVKPTIDEVCRTCHTTR